MSAILESEPATVLTVKLMGEPVRFVFDAWTVALPTVVEVVRVTLAMPVAFDVVLDPEREPAPAAMAHPMVAPCTVLL